MLKPACFFIFLSFSVEYVKVTAGIVDSNMLVAGKS